MNNYIDMLKKERALILSRYNELRDSEGGGHLNTTAKILSDRIEELEGIHERSKSYTVKVEEDEKTGDLLLPFTPEILDEVGWKIGDSVDWKDNHDGSFTLSKVDNVWVMVDAVLTYRMRYCVQTPVTNPEYALDSVAMEDAKEFSQLSIGEQIVSLRIVSEEEAIAMCDIDNDYCKEWTSEMKIESFFTKEGEEKGWINV